MRLFKHLLYLLRTKPACMTKFVSIVLMTSVFCVAKTGVNAQEILTPLNSASIVSFPDSTKKDTLVYTPFKDLPLKPEREVKFTTSEGTWMSVDISPDGQTIAFDLMGDIYTMPAVGGKATRVTTGIAYETHPRFSPDGKKILFTSDRTGSDNIWYIDMEKKIPSSLPRTGRKTSLLRYGHPMANTSLHQGEDASLNYGCTTKMAAAAYN